MRVVHSVFWRIVIATAAGVAAIAAVWGPADVPTDAEAVRRFGLLVFVGLTFYWFEPPRESDDEALRRSRRRRWRQERHR